MVVGELEPKMTMPESHRPYGSGVTSALTSRLTVSANDDCASVEDLDAESLEVIDMKSPSTQNKKDPSQIFLLQKKQTQQTIDSVEDDEFTDILMQTIQG